MRRRKVGISHRHLVCLRNGFAGICACLFLTSLVAGRLHREQLRCAMLAAAYFCGAVAYGLELVELKMAGAHSTRPGHRFMPFAFSILYLLLGVNYCFH